MDKKTKERFGVLAGH